MSDDPIPRTSTAPADRHRTAELTRSTSESRVHLRLDLDGTGQSLRDPWQVLGMDGGVERLDRASEAVAVHAEQLEQPVVPPKFAGDEIPVERPDPGRVDRELPDHPVGFVLRAQRSELELGHEVRLAALVGDHREWHIMPHHLA